MEWLPAPSNQKGRWQLLKAVLVLQYPSSDAGRAKSLQNKASGPAWSGNLRCGSAWVKTTSKSFTSFRDISVTVPLFLISPAHCWNSLQLLSSGNLIRAHRKLWSPFNSPRYRECSPWLPLSLEQNQWPHLTTELSAHSRLNWVPKQQVVFILGPVLHSPIYYWLWYPALTISKSNQRIQSTMEPILKPYLGREPSQQSSPTVLSQRHTPLHPCPQNSPESSGWALGELPHPKINNGRPHLLKDIARRHTQKPQMSWMARLPK